MGSDCAWYLLLPVGLSALYGYTEYRAMAALGFHRAGIRGLAVGLTGAALTTAWCMLGFPLPLFYLLTYLLRTLRHMTATAERSKNWFLLNLSFVNMLALHLVLIGSIALARGAAMHQLLADAFWRTVSIAVVLVIIVAEDVLFLRSRRFSALLAAESVSEEARPFMAFLWFCTGYLLADSLLCVAELEPLYPPLFLIGSSVVLMFFIIRFLLHIYAIMENEHLKDEHDQLAAKLEFAKESAGTFQRMADRDALTGVYSRRYVLERIEALMGTGTPFSLAFLDLDGLKAINDRQGHEAGDRYLIRFAAALSASLRGGDVVARVGGDEFVLLLPGCAADSAARRIEVLRGAERRFSFGMTTFQPGDDTDVDALLRLADHAMYRDKENRRRGEGPGQ